MRDRGGDEVPLKSLNRLYLLNGPVRARGRHGGHRGGQQLASPREVSRACEANRSGEEKIGLSLLSLSLPLPA